MSAAVTSSPAEAYGGAVTLTLTGLTATTKYLCVVGHVGTVGSAGVPWSAYNAQGTIIPFSSDGSGNATVTYQPGLSVSGTLTVNVYLQPVFAASAATTTFVVKAN